MAQYLIRTTVPMLKKFAFLTALSGIAYLCTLWVNAGN